MPNDNWSKKVIDLQIPPGVNIRGSQKKWNHNVKKDMELLGLKTCQRRFQIFRVQKGTHIDSATIVGNERRNIKNVCLQIV